MDGFGGSLIGMIFLLFSSLLCFIIGRSSIAFFCRLIPAEIVMLNSCRLNILMFRIYN